MSEKDEQIQHMRANLDRYKELLLREVSNNLALTRQHEQALRYLEGLTDSPLKLKVIELLTEENKAP